MVTSTFVPARLIITLTPSTQLTKFYWRPLIEMNTATINKLLTALNECTEWGWGQVTVFDSFSKTLLLLLAGYFYCRCSSWTLSNCDPKDEKKAQSICERITPRLAHDNAAVVLSAVKVTALKITIFA